MVHSFIAYIDESGDEGFGKYRVPGTKIGGSSQWLCISACIVRASRRLETVQWRDEIKDLVQSKAPGRAIHFKDLGHAQRRAACQVLGQKQIRLVSAIAHKPDLEPTNFATKNALYHYLARFVVERVSWFCRDERPRVQEGDGRVKIVFSRRGGMSYEDFQTYLRYLKAEVSTSVHWPVIDIDRIEAMDHSRDAGLQLADIAASAVAAAFEPDRFGNTEMPYLQAPSARIYRRGGKERGYGLKVFPDEDRLQSEQLAAIIAKR